MAQRATAIGRFGCAGGLAPNRGRERKGGPPGWWARMEVAFARPSFAAAFVIACVLLGLFLAEARISRLQAERSAQLAKSYLRLIDPLLRETTDDRGRAASAYEANLSCDNAGIVAERWRISAGSSPMGARARTIWGRKSGGCRRAFDYPRTNSPGSRRCTSSPAAAPGPGGGGGADAGGICRVRARTADDGQC